VLEGIKDTDTELLPLIDIDLEGIKDTDAELLPLIDTELEEVKDKDAELEGIKDTDAELLPVIDMAKDIEAEGVRERLDDADKDVDGVKLGLILNEDEALREADCEVVVDGEI